MIDRQSDDDDDDDNDMLDAGCWRVARVCGGRRAYGMSSRRGFGWAGPLPYYHVEFILIVEST